MKPKRILIALLSFVFLMVMASACQSAGSNFPGEQAKKPSALESTTAVTPPSLLLTPVVDVADTADPENESLPLRFTFPTPQPPPVSLWRPPLYDVPWALGPFDHFYFKRPIAADEVNWPLADYRYGGMLPKSVFIHSGVDIDAPLHTPILAAGAGTVISAGYGLYAGSNDKEDPYGLAVTIEHDFGYQGRKLFTIYAHMDRILVQYGQHVESGDALGIVGLTGNTTGPHLHFEVRLDNNVFFNTRNPELWLAPPQGWGVLAGKLHNTNGSFLTGQEVIVTSKTNGDKWVVISYHNNTVNGDEYYQENVVLSDLPAGDYDVLIVYNEKPLKAEMTIRPGAVTFFTFRGRYGFDFRLPKEIPGEMPASLSGQK
jgi:murein DD-endopeptidase MepM/ murein hydrolase activator NlpD